MSEVKYESKESVQRSLVMVDDVLGQFVAAILWNVEMKLAPIQLEKVEKETLARLRMCGISLQRLGYLISREECAFSHPRPPFAVDKRTMLMLLGWGQSQPFHARSPQEEAEMLPQLHMYGVYVQDLAGFFPPPTKLISDHTLLLLHAIHNSSRRTCDVPLTFFRLIQRVSPRAYHRASSVFASQVMLQIIFRHIAPTTQTPAPR